MFFLGRPIVRLLALHQEPFIKSEIFHILLDRFQALYVESQFVAYYWRCLRDEAITCEMNFFPRPFSTAPFRNFLFFSRCRLFDTFFRELTKANSKHVDSK